MVRVSALCFSPAAAVGVTKEQQSGHQWTGTSCQTPEAAQLEVLLRLDQRRTACQLSHGASL